MTTEEISTNIHLKVVEFSSIDKNNEHTALPKTNDMETSLILGCGFVVIIFIVYVFFLKKVYSKYTNF